MVSVYRDRATTWHRLDGISEEIDKELNELAGIALYLGQIVRAVKIDLYLLLLSGGRVDSDDVVKQGVPDRFKNLLQELDEGADSPHVTTAMPRSIERPEQGKGDDAADEDALPDRLMDDEDLADPGRNGSH